MSATAALGRFVADSQWDDISPTLRHEGKRSLLNSIGCALGVARSEPVEMAVRTLLPLSGADRVTVVGRAERLDILGAAFVNAIGANLLDYDDTHLRTVIHPAAPVLPAVLALAEQRNLSGAIALHAFILGMEVECRIGNAVSPGHYARGWHITSTCGIFGAAAASAKLLGLNAEQTAHAIGVASSQSAGTIENLPSAGKNVSVGNAARNGLFAALLAEQGYNAASTALEGALGWARAMGDVPVVEEMTGELGSRWEAGKNTYKPYPAGIVMHAVVDACLALKRDHAIKAADIAEVVVSGEQLLLDRGDRVVTGERDARVSIHHCAAVAFLFEAAGLREFEDACVHNPDVAAFRGRVVAQLDTSSPRGAATATVRLLDGRSFSATVLHAKGSSEQKLSDKEIEAKVRDSAEHGGFGGNVDAVIAAAWGAEDLSAIGRLVRAVAATAS